MYDTTFFAISAIAEEEIRIQPTAKVVARRRDR